MQNSLPFAILRRAYALTDIRHHHPSVRVIDRLRPLDAMQHRSNWHRALATVLAEERRGRTAEDERRDVLAYLERYDRGSYGGGNGVASAVLRIMIERLQRGDHEGASTR